MSYYPFPGFPHSFPIKQAMSQDDQSSQGTVSDVPPEEVDDQESDEKTEDHEGLPPVDTKGDKFRLQSQQVLLTYSQIGDWSHNDFYGAICASLAARGLSVVRAVYALEYHKDGGRHVHLLLRFNRKPNLRGQSVLDVKLGGQSFHPNIRVIRGKKEGELRAMAYVMKGGDFVDTGYKEVHLRRITGYVRAAADFAAYEDHCRRSAVRPAVGEIVFPGDIRFALGAAPECRRRHLFVFGDPFTGKTTCVDTQIPINSTFPVGVDVKSRFEDYTGAPILYYNDCWPESLSELAGCCDVRPFRVKVPGFTRYRNYYFEAKSVRTVIIVRNELPDFGTYKLQKAFATRFRGIRFCGRYPDVTVREVGEDELLGGYSDPVPFSAEEGPFRRYPGGGLEVPKEKQD